MEGLSRSFVGFILRRETLMERLAQGFDPIRVLDLRTELVCDVKYVGYLIHIG